MSSPEATSEMYQKHHIFIFEFCPHVLGKQAVSGQISLHRFQKSFKSGNQRKLIDPDRKPSKFFSQMFDYFQRFFNNWRILIFHVKAPVSLEFERKNTVGNVFCHKIMLIQKKREYTFFRFNLKNVEMLVY